MHISHSVPLNQYVFHKKVGTLYAINACHAKKINVFKRFLLKITLSKESVCLPLIKPFEW